MNHPFHFIPAASQRILFWPLLGLAVLLMAVFGITGAPMNTDAAPYGVVSYELAGSTHRAETILASWNADARARAAFGLGLDFLFIPVYTSTLAIACGMASHALRRRDWPLSSLGSYLAWGLILAGIFDLVENIGLTVILLGPVAAPWPQIATVCAICKFLLLFLGLVYAILGLAVTLVNLATSHNDR